MRLVEVVLNGAVVGYVKSSNDDTDSVVDERVADWLQNNIEWEVVKTYED